MMKAIPIRTDDRSAPAAPVSEPIELDLTLMAGTLFWMTLVALAVISFAL